ncbi:MAG: 50S ribosomal protein L4 [Firmicutes bacterium]|nr:50S ribosomal protein L4 [Bacillota bacterium]
MATLNVYKQTGEKKGSLKVDDSVFGQEFNEALVHQVIVAQRNNARQGTKCTLTRAEVRGGGRKPWRQKGTGRARQGSIRSPQWNKGGVVFAPKPRDFSQKVNKQAKRLAIVSALSKKATDNEILVLEDLKIKEAKTKEIAVIMKALKLNIKTHIAVDENGKEVVKVSKALPKVLLVVTDGDEDIIRATGNIPYVKTISSNLINVYDLMVSDRFVATTAAIQKIEKAYKEELA